MRLHVPCNLAPRVLYFSAFFINPRHACAAKVTVLGLSVCLSVCLSVHAYSGTTAAYKRNQRLQNRKWVKINKAIFQKRLRSGDMA